MTARWIIMPITLCRICAMMFALYLVLLQAGCATTRADLSPEVPAMHTIDEFSDDEDWIARDANDPWETFNRRMYRFNYNFDKYVFLPVVSGYEFISPSFVQTGVSNFFDNIYEIRTLYNSLFQLKGKKALTTLGRFVTNSTIGIGGLFDVADTFGLKRQNEDFDQTLGYWGASAGPYLVLPILGPNTVRSATGYGVDAGIRLLMLDAIDPFENCSANDTLAIESGITALEAINLRHKQKFRYYESGYPFEYYIVRFLYRQNSELMIMK
jgi:phospholipid-binding lipoprotein MlaA